MEHPVLLTWQSFKHHIYPQLHGNNILNVAAKSGQNQTNELTFRDISASIKSFSFSLCVVKSFLVIIRDY